MKRLTALALCLALLCALPAARGAEKEEALWTRSEGDGAYVSVRVPFPEGEGLDWSAQQSLCVRYADDKRPVALTSDYIQGYLFATVPAQDAGRPLEVFRGEAFHFADTVTVWNGDEYYDAPVGTDTLRVRGVLRGDAGGNLNPDAVLTRAEAFALVVRLLGIPEEGEYWADWYHVNGESTGYGDVAPSAWYFPVAAAAQTYGLAAPGAYFYPDRPVTRAEFTVILHRAMQRVGWLGEDAAAGKDPAFYYADADQLPDWAAEAYVALSSHGVAVIETWYETGEMGDDGPVYALRTEPDKPATRGEVIETIASALSYLPCFPYQRAIDWGFDREMPALDGSTSTYPYTRAVYGALFRNYENHPQYPAAHSKSHESYERLIAGEVDALFAATKASAELEAKAQAAGVALEYVPIAHDAMVFFTNAENSISGLTQKQIQEIYVESKYTNWNQVGGPDAALLPYRRNTDSGSHALMERYFLEGGRLSLSPDVHNVLTSYAMSSALTDVAQALETNPPAYALGYSVYYYYLTGYWLLGDAGGGELKLLAVDGVLPSDETIADFSYPLADYNYLVLRADTPQDAPARRLAEFMLSEAGQECVSNAGYGPLSGGPAADLAAQLPGWTVEEVFPLDVGYAALSWDEGRQVLRGSYLERRSDKWGELTGADCPVPAEGGLSSAVLGARGHSLVFGSVGGGTSGVYAIRLLLEDGGSRTCDAHPGGTFRFVLELEERPQALELLVRGAAPARFPVGG